MYFQPEHRFYFNNFIDVYHPISVLYTLYTHILITNTEISCLSDTHYISLLQGVKVTENIKKYIVFLVEYLLLTFYTCTCYVLTFYTRTYMLCTCALFSFEA